MKSENKENLMVSVDVDEKTKVSLSIDVPYWCRHLLSQLDRDPLSPTAGSFDRKYWAWKARDFSDATLQYAGVPLLKAARCNHKNLGVEEQSYYIDAAIAAGTYLHKIQHRDGSFDQCYPYEKHPGVVMDVLPLWIMLLGDFSDRLDSETEKLLAVAVDRAIGFILRTKESYAVISNHLAHYAHVLLSVDQQWNVPECRRLADRYLETLFENQSEEGWYLEYQGPDMGYQTRTLSYLSRIVQIRGDSAIEESMQRAITFLSYFAYPDGTFGGVLGSRNTAIVYLYGLALNAKVNPDASALVHFIIRGQEVKRGVLLHQMDLDNCVRVYDDYLDATEELTKIDLVEPNRLPFQRERCDVDFMNAGIVVRRRHWYYVVVNLAKGGIHKVFDVLNEKLVNADTGWVYKKKGTVYTNHYFQKKDGVSVASDKTTVHGRFYKVNAATLTPFKMIILRLLNMTIWRIQFVADVVRKIITKVLYARNISGDMHFERSYEWEDAIRIETTLNWKHSEKRRIVFTTNFTSVPMASAKYFQLADIYGGSSCSEKTFNPGERYVQVVGRQGVIGG